MALPPDTTDATSTIRQAKGAVPGKVVPRAVPSTGTRMGANAAVRNAAAPGTVPRTSRAAMTLGNVAPQPQLLAKGGLVKKPLGSGTKTKSVGGTPTFSVPTKGGKNYSKRRY